MPTTFLGSTVPERREQARSKPPSQAIFASVAIGIVVCFFSPFTFPLSPLLVETINHNGRLRWVVVLVHTTHNSATVEQHVVVETINPT